MSEVIPQLQDAKDQSTNGHIQEPSDDSTLLDRSDDEETVKGVPKDVEEVQAELKDRNEVKAEDRDQPGDGLKDGNEKNGTVTENQDTGHVQTGKGDPKSTPNSKPQAGGVKKALESGVFGGQ